MRSMGNVKRLVQWASLLLVLLYLAIIVVDQWVTRATVGNSYPAGVQTGLSANGKAAEALIVGGSNAMYGLSARQLTKQLNMRFQNLALEQEGRSHAAYSNYLQGLAQTSLDPEKIRLVVYSSVSPLRKGNIEIYRNSNQDIFGQVPFSIKPRTDVRRLLTQAKTIWSTSEWLRPDGFGDLDFKSEPCDLPLTDVGVETESLDVLLPFFQERVLFLKRLFPNAKIVVVVPSEFYADAQLPTQWKQELQQGMDDLKLENTELIIQPALPKAQWVCELRHHPNAEGRAWRTADLSTSLRGVAFSVLAGR